MPKCLCKSEAENNLLPFKKDLISLSQVQNMRIHLLDSLSSVIWYYFFLCKDVGHHVSISVLWNKHIDEQKSNNRNPKKKHRSETPLVFLILDFWFRNTLMCSEYPWFAASHQHLVLSAATSNMRNILSLESLPMFSKMLSQNWCLKGFLSMCSLKERECMG